MRARGTGFVFQKTYKDKRTGEARKTETYWIAYSHRGVRHEETSGSTNRGDAVRLLKRRLGEIGRGRLIGPDAERVTFADLARMVKDDYRNSGRKSLDRAEDAIRDLEEAFTEWRALDITTDRLTA